MRNILLFITACLLTAVILAGCGERAPKGLKGYTKGKCAICERTTQVRQLVMNPDLGYGLNICWRKECSDKLAANMKQYIDESKLPPKPPGYVDPLTDPSLGGPPTNAPAQTTPAPVAPPQ